MRKLGIIAGAGNLPAKIIKECQKQKRPFFVLALKGHAEPDLIPDNIECEWVRVGDIKKSIDICKAAGVQDVLMIGAVKRPSFWELRPDWYGIKFLLKIGWKALGDDGLLKAVIGRIEELGFKVIGADDILTDSVASKGIYGKVKPSKQALKDIAKGFNIAKILGQADVGQGVIVADGLVLGVEAIEGTDALIERCKSLHRQKTKGVLVKVKKPNQERRADLPTIGIQTVQNAYKSGLAGIAVEAGGAFVVDKNAVAKLADKYGIFVMGVDETCQNVR